MIRQLGFFVRFFLVDTSALHGSTFAQMHALHLPREGGSSCTPTLSFFPSGCSCSGVDVNARVASAVSGNPIGDHPKELQSPRQRRRKTQGGTSSATARDDFFKRNRRYRGGGTVSSSRASEQWNRRRGDAGAPVEAV